MKKIRRLLIIAGVTFAAFWLLGCVILRQPVFSSGKKSVLSVDPETLQKHVRMISEEFAPRDCLHVKNLDRCADYIRAELEKTGAKVRFQEYEVAGRKYRNVIARFDAGDENLIVVGAHYDACNDTPGADDNASGVAGLLELAVLFGRHPTGRNIELVAYTLEEPPYFRSADMGSARHAKELHEKGTKIQGAVVLEMIGYFNDDLFSQGYPFPLLRLFYPSRGNFVAVAGRLDQIDFMRRLKKNMVGATSLPVYTINAPVSLPGLDFSDHLNYWEQGWDAVMVTDTAFYRNREYHAEGDTWDRLDYRRMADVVVSVYEGIKEL